MMGNHCCCPEIPKQVGTRTKTFVSCNVKFWFFEIILANDGGIIFRVKKIGNIGVLLMLSKDIGFVP